MDLNYTPEDIAFRKQVRTWLEENLPRKEIRTLDDRLGWHRKLYEAGYLGMGWPKEYGGGGARPMEQAIVAGHIEAAPQNRMFHGAFRCAIDARKVARAEGRSWNATMSHVRFDRVRTPC